MDTIELTSSMEQTESGTELNSPSKLCNVLVILRSNFADVNPP